MHKTIVICDFCALEITQAQWPYYVVNNVNTGTTTPNYDLHTACVARWAEELPIPVPTTP